MYVGGKVGLCNFTESKVQCLTQVNNWGAFCWNIEKKVAAFYSSPKYCSLFVFEPIKLV